MAGIDFPVPKTTFQHFVMACTVGYMYAILPELLTGILPCCHVLPLITLCSASNLT